MPVKSGLQLSQILLIFSASRFGGNKTGWIHPWWHRKSLGHRDMSLERKMNFCSSRLFAIQTITLAMYSLLLWFVQSVAVLCKNCNHFCVCNLSLFLHICAVTSRYYFSFFSTSRGWPKMAEKCRRTSTCSCVIVPNYSAAVDIDMFVNCNWVDTRWQ